MLNWRMTKIYWIVPTLFSVAFAAAILGLLVTQDSDRIASIWSANAILLSALLINPRKYWAAISVTVFAAYVLANLAIGDSLSIAFMLAAVNIIESIIGAFLLRKLVKGYNKKFNLNWFFNLLFYGALLPCMVSASLASAILASGMADFTDIWAVYFPAHFIGIMTISPVIIILNSTRKRAHGNNDYRHLLIVGLASIATSAIIFFQALPITFLIFPILIWSAFKAGVPGAALSIFIFTFISTGLTIRGYGPIVLLDSSENMRVLFLQALIIIATLTTMPIAMVLSERLKNEHKLKKAKQYAEAAAVAKGRFVANISHEIRTPLNGIMGFAQLLANEPLNHRQHRQSRLILDSANNLMDLVNDVLDFSKIEAKQLHIVCSPVNVSALIDDCAEHFKEATASKNIALIHGCAANNNDEASRAKTLSSADIWVMADKMRIRQILFNLIGNAVKFTHEGSVTIAANIVVRDEQTLLMITVTDTGIGINPSRQSQIFEEFEQAGEDTDQHYGGTGLGLAITQRLANLQGGTICMNSEISKGSCFTLEIPAKVINPPISDPQPSDIPLSHSPLSHAPQYADPLPRFEHDYKILVVDDVDINLEIIGEMLGQFGAIVDFAQDGRGATDMILNADLTDTPYNIIFMDNHMPKMGGIEAIAKIRASGIHAAQLPIIGLTANMMSENIDANLRAGAQDVLAKPITAATLYAAVTRFAVQPETSSVTVQIVSPDKADPQLIYQSRKANTLELLNAFAMNGFTANVTLDALVNAAHQMAGTAGFFDDSKFGDANSQLENYIRSGSAQKNQIEAMIIKIKNAA